MTDQWTKHLADKGYTAISLPSDEFRLLTLTFERNGGRGHENAFDQLAAGIRQQLPEPDKNVNIPAIAGERTRTVDVSAGLKLLSGLIAALGAGTLGLDAGFKAARKVTFAYDGLSSETLNAVLLQNLLNTVKAPAGGLLRDWLDDHLYVITSVLRAKKISVTAHDQSGVEVGLDVPVIEGAASGKIGFNFSGTNDSTVTFDGETPVPVAVRLFQVEKTKVGGERMLTLKTVKEGAVTVKAIAGAGHFATGLPVIDGLSDGEDADEPTAVVLDWNPEQEAEGTESMDRVKESELS